MIYRVLGLTLTGLVLSACTTTTPVREDGFLAELPEGLAEAAAPGQNLGSVRIRPEDGCYWYEYTGPVETTLLPLRTPDGRQICTHASGESA
jgi:hypothetical protein